MHFNQHQLCQMIPHSGEMCLLDHISRWDDDSITCIAYSQACSSNPLYQQQLLPSICGVEYAAQAMAVHAAVLSPGSRPPAAAFLAGLRSVKLFTETINEYPELEVSCHKLASDNNGLIYDFFIQHQNQKLVSGRATVIRQKE